MMVTMEVFVAAFSSLAVIVAGAFFWVMTDIRTLRKDDIRGLREEMRTDNRTLREDLLAAIRTESEARRADTQRILDAIYHHRHDPDGSVALRSPTEQVAD